MEKPNVKESVQAVMQKLGFLKNYTSLMAPLGIFLAAIIVLVFTQMMVGKLSEQIQRESLSVGGDVQRLTSTAVSKDQWQQEKEYQDAYRQDANAIAAVVVQSSQRPLLSYKIFPSPVDSSSLIFKEFGQKFRFGIGAILNKIKSGDCPSQEELAKHISITGQAASMGYTNDEPENVNSAITNVLCLDKAKEACVYVNPVVISGHQYWDNYLSPGVSAAIEDCWYWQLGYWIIEDVLETVGKVNYGSANVFASPVKRVMKISFNTGLLAGSDYQSADSGGLGYDYIADSVRPSYIFFNPDPMYFDPGAAEASSIGIPQTCTGRICNENIDVVHFSISVLVDTRAVADFMKELCSVKPHTFTGYLGNEEPQIFKHNQITILSYNSVPIDRQDPMHVLYRYGEDAVVQLDLTCEYIFVKEGYDAIKPEAVKKLLNPDPATGTQMDYYGS